VQDWKPCPTIFTTYSMEYSGMILKQQVDPLANHEVVTVTRGGGSEQQPES